MIILPSSVQGAKKRERTGAAIHTPRSIEVEYRRALLELSKVMEGATRLIGQAVNAGTSRAEVLALIRNQIAQSKRRYEQAAVSLPQSMTASLSARGKDQVQNMIKRSLGVDFATIIDGPAVAEQLATAQLSNAQLITKLPEEHWARVVQSVSDNYDGTLNGSLTQRLREVNGISKNRAKVIARDQTSKLSGALNGIRQQEAGIDEYAWRNSRDSRVVGNPSGLYPTGSAKHRDHWSREGKRYKWSEPPPDGHPGQPILCRCRPEPVINLDTLNAQFV